MANNLTKIQSQEVFDSQYYGNRYGYPQEEDNAIDLRALVRSLWGYKWSILFITLIFSISATVWSLSIIPSYRAIGTIHIQREVEKVTSHKITVQGGEKTDKDFYQTQYELLKSRDLAKRVIDKLKNKNKEQNENKNKDNHIVIVKKEQGKAIFSEYINKIKAWVKEVKKIAGLNTEVKFPPHKPTEKVRKASEVTQFLAGLTIIPLQDSQIVTIQYDHNDPNIASERANGIANGFVEMNLDRRSASRDYAKEFLVEQLAIAKKELEEKEKLLAEYAKRHSLTASGGQVELVDKRLIELSSAVTRAENARIDIESRYHYNSLGVGRATINPVLDNGIMAALRTNRAKLKAEYQDKLKIFKPDYPSMLSLNKQIQQLERDIRAEQSRTKSAVKTETNMGNLSLKKALDAAREKEQKLRKALSLQKDKSFDLKEDKIGYDSLEREVNTSRDNYQSLLAREIEVRIASVGGKNNISVVDEAETPPHPFKPNVKFNIIIGTAIGLFLGIVWAFLRNLLNDTVRSSAEIEKISRLPILGTIPRIKTKKVEAQALQTFNHPQSAVAEACRSLRTTLLFSTFGDPKVLLITSPMPNEGKTTTAINLASAFMQAGKKVLLIDADLRKPSLHGRLKLDNSLGFANCLSDKSSIQDAIQYKVLGELSILTAGTVLNNPIGLFSRENMTGLLQELLEIFDNIILDAPPVMGLADSLILANVASITLMVVSHEQTTGKMLNVACDKIHQAQGNLVGCIYTKARLSEDLYVYGDKSQYGLIS